MEYFQLSQDLRYRNAILFPNMLDLLSYGEITNGTVIGLKEVNPMLLPANEFAVYPDVLSRQIFAVQEPVKAVFDLFEPDIPYKLFCTMDLKNRKKVNYHVPQLQAVPCDPTASQAANPAKAGGRAFAVERRHIQFLDIFRIVEEHSQLVIVSLPVAECILRRKPFGVRLERVNIV